MITTRGLGQIPAPEAQDLSPEQELAPIGRKVFPPAEPRGGAIQAIFLTIGAIALLTLLQR